MINYYTLLIKNTNIMYMYALFNAAFSHLSTFPIAQTVMTLLLPVLKLAAKNWIYVNVQRMGSFKIEMLIFNIEIFHALYVVFFMQSATSRDTVAVLVFLDAGQACATLRRIMQLAGSRRMSARLVDVTKCWSRRITPIPGMKADSKDPQLIRLAVYILETNSSILQSSGLNNHLSQSEPHIAGTSEDQHASNGSEQKLPAPAAANISNLFVNPSTGPDKLQKQQLPDPKTQQCTVNSGIRLNGDEKRATSALIAAERREKVHSALQLLHRTELIVLVEYVELVIPFVYCLYLLVMSHLPNRVYYAQLCQLAGDVQLDQKRLNILLYACLELLSFLVLTWLLDRALRVSSVHQLAFVLETQWRMVQTKFVFWIMFTVQSSLLHFGTDYSFQFEWLHHARPT